MSDFYMYDPEMCDGVGCTGNCDGCIIPEQYEQENDKCD